MLVFEAVRSIDFWTMFLSAFLSVSTVSVWSELLSLRIDGAINLTYATRVVGVASDNFGLYSFIYCRIVLKKNICKQIFVIHSNFFF